MKKTLLLLILCINLSFAQNKQGQKEIALPLHPWALLMGSYYGDFEYFHSPKRSTTARIGYQGDNFLISYFSNVHIRGKRVDIGQRWYLKGETSKYIRFYAGVNATLEYTSVILNDRGFANQQDSLNISGFSFAPEVNAGVKLVFFKKITFTPSLGLRYYFNSLKTDNLTKNPQYWAFDDWDNGQPNWEDNRRTAELRNFRKGLMIVPFIHIGFIF